MKKALGLALALLVTIVLPVAAEEVTSITLDADGNVIVVDRHITTLTPGDQVPAMFQADGSKNIVTDLDLRGFGSDARGTTNWGPSYGTELNSIQAE